MSRSSNKPFPDFFRLRQNFQSLAIADLSNAVNETIHSVGFPDHIRSGQKVAIAVGSRGINNLRQIITEVVRVVSAAGGNPFIVPAMGSHGGASAEGQAAVLASYGIEPKFVGCPVVASMETVLVGTTADGIDVHFDKVASQADHVIAVNRVKPHTRLSGHIESGIVKMLMIGLGKNRGAKLYHQVFPLYDYSLDDLAPKIVPMLVERMPISLGLAIVEDAFEQTSTVQAIRPGDLLTEEPKLLELAKSQMPRLPFDHADLLIVDQIGKEISGTGLDTNVVGRKQNDRCAAADESPKIRQIYLRSLTHKTAGNACGVGISEYCHQDVVDAMDKEVTKINCVTGAHVTAGAIPLAFNSDRLALEAVTSQFGKDRVPNLNWMWISDTLHLSELACSGSYLAEASERSDLEVVSEQRPLAFNQHGNLVW